MIVSIPNNRYLRWRAKIDFQARFFDLIEKQIQERDYYFQEWVKLEEQFDSYD